MTCWPSHALLDADLELLGQEFQIPTELLRQLLGVMARNGATTGAGLSNRTSKSDFAVDSTKSRRR